MIDEAKAQPFRYLALQRFQFRIDEFDDLAGFNIDHVIVMSFGRRLVASTAIAEVMPVKNSGFLEKTNGAVHRGNGNARINSRSALVQLFDVRMIDAFRQNSGNNSPLFGDA